MLVAIGLTILLAVLGGMAGLRRDASHHATTTILVNPLQGNPFNPDRGDDLINMETEAQLVTSDAVSRLVAERIGANSSAGMLKGIQVSVPVNTQLIKITVADPTSAAAVKRAEAFADSYLDYRASRSKAVVASRVQDLDEQAKAAESEVARRTKELVGLSAGSPRLSAVQQQISAANAQLNSLKTEISGLQASPQDPGQVVTPAALDARGPLPGWLMGAIAGLMLGAGGSVSFLLVRLRRAGFITASGDLQAAGLDLLGTPSDADMIRSRVLAGVDADPEQWPGATVVLLAAVGPQATLDPWREVAEAFARARYRTLRVRFDTAGDGPGLLDVLRGDIVLDEVVLRRSGDDAAFGHGAAHQVLAGTPLNDGEATDLGAAATLPRLVEALSSRADVVLVEGLEVPGATGDRLVGMVDQVVLLIEQGESRAAQLGAATALAGRSGTRVTGFVWHRGAGSAAERSARETSAAEVLDLVPVIPRATSRHRFEREPGSSPSVLTYRLVGPTVERISRIMARETESRSPGPADDRGSRLP